MWESVETRKGPARKRTGPFLVNCYTPPMKPGTILIAIGAAIIIFVALAVYYVGLFNFPMLLVGLAGLVVAGVGASRRWERTAR